MTIRIVRNEAGNCINFQGSSNPVYFNACLSGQVDPDVTSTINVINDIQSVATAETKYEFYQIPFTEFSDRDGNPFATAQEAADYITSQGNVTGVGTVGTDMAGTEINFRVDQTSTSIILDNGYHFGVNTIKAVPDADGTIHIHAIDSGLPSDADSTYNRTHFDHIDHTLVKINGASVSGGLNDVVNALNELFTVGAFQAVVISDPYSTMIADVGGTSVATTIIGSGVDPAGDDVYGATVAGSLNGYKSVETIDQAGEYFTFDIRNESQIGFGLVHSDASYAAGYYTGNSSYANPSTFGTSNSAHYGFQFSHWFHPTPNGSWTNYGASTGYVQGPGWVSANTQFEARDEWLAGDPIKIKVGIDENGFIAISSLKDDGVTWVLHARTNYPVPQGSEFHLGVKCGDTVGRVYTLPKVHLLEPAAPVMQFRYIESGDGNFNYPLFATAEEANYYDLNHDGTVGTGTSSQIVFPDDPTFTQWYAPTTGYTNNGTVAPSGTFMSNTINWTEITSLTNADLVPAAYAATTIEVNELQSVSIQTQPADSGYTTTLSGLPSGMIAASDGSISGTAPEVTGDNVANPSDDYAVTVTRTNSYGSSTGTLTIRVVNLTAPTVTAISGFTWEAASTALVDADTLDDGSVVSIDDTVADGRRLIIPASWVEAYVLPALQASGDTVRIGLASGSADWSTVEDADYDAMIMWSYVNSSTHSVVMAGDLTLAYNVASLTQAFYDYAFELDGTDLWMIGCNINSINTEPAVNDGGSFSYTNDKVSVTGPVTLHISVTSSQMDISATGLSEIDIPATSSNQTSWTKAVDFSGNAERAMQANSSPLYTPLKMAGSASTVAAPTAGQTVASGHPWATAVVFKIDGHSSNQHIWNLGEGANVTDDNIYLRLDSTKNLHFGWGRSGALNECQLSDISSTTGEWHAVYVGFNGTRLSGANASASNLAAAFDIHYARSGNSWTLSADQSNFSNWTAGSTGGRMDREFNGYMTVGGRGSNRSFHGKVASFVSTTLRCGVAMPTTAEITEMITDPVGWVQDYKIGNSYRRSPATTDASNFQLDSYDPASATQVWLMGDGALDSYSNMIRSYIFPAEQNRYKLNLISMVSNDIENVTISGLS